MSAIEVPVLSKAGLDFPMPVKLEGVLAYFRAQLVAGGTSGMSTPSEDLLPLLLDASETRVWVCEPIATETAPEILDEIKSLSGLTWDQIGRAMGVNRRSVHFWLNGRPLSADKEERLHTVAQVIRTLTADSQLKTRTRLLDKSGGRSVFDHLVAGTTDEAMTLANARAASTQSAVLFSHTPRRLSDEARAARRSPLDPIDRLEDVAHVAISPPTLKSARRMKRRTDD